MEQKEPMPRPTELPKPKLDEPKLDDKAQAKKDALEKCQAILKEHDGMESNISYHHEYWTLKNIYQAQ